MDCMFCLAKDTVKAERGENEHVALGRQSEQASAKPITLKVPVVFFRCAECGWVWINEEQHDENIHAYLRVRLKETGVLMGSRELRDLTRAFPQSLQMRAEMLGVSEQELFAAEEGFGTLSPAAQRLAWVLSRSQDALHHIQRLDGIQVDQSTVTGVAT